MDVLPDEVTTSPPFRLSLSVDVVDAFLPNILRTDRNDAPGENEGDSVPVLFTEDDLGVGARKADFNADFGFVLELEDSVGIIAPCLVIGLGLGVDGADLGWSEDGAGTEV